MNTSNQAQNIISKCQNIGQIIIKTPLAYLKSACSFVAILFLDVELLTKNANRSDIHFQHDI